MLAELLSLFVTITRCASNGEWCISNDGYCADIDIANSDIQISVCLDDILSWCTTEECSSTSSSDATQLFELTSDPVSECNIGVYKETNYFQCCRPLTTSTHRCCGVATTHGSSGATVEAFCLDSPCGPTSYHKNECGNGI